MSKSAETASEKEPAEPQNDSVFDFIYCDTRRIASFLAQFDDAGHLEKVIQRETASKTKKRGFSVSVGGGATVAGTGGSGSFAVNRGPGVEGSEATERIYDPLWTNARALLDFIDDRDMVVRDLQAAKMGQFVLAAGLLVILDIGLMKGAWEKASLKKVLEDSFVNTLKTNQPGLPAHLKKESITEQRKIFHLTLEMLTLMPHSLQAKIFSPNGLIWSNLDDASLVGKPSDFVLKHGAFVQGQWSILGILDAVPDVKSEDTDVDKFVAQNTAEVIGQMTAQMAPLAREMMGRPRNAFGMTPLLIFREVAGRSGAPEEMPGAVPSDAT